MAEAPRYLRRSQLLLVGVLATGCTDPASEAGGSTTEGEPMDSRWPLPHQCPPPAGLGQPATIDEVVTLVNALPRPTSLACLLESLERPINVYASTSVAGAQPATGSDNPRIFLLRGDLTMSVVPEGEASQTLELSQAIGERQSIKAELVFPVEQQLPPSAPYDTVAFVGGTSCGLCHGQEAPVPSIEFASAYASEVFQDDPDESLSLSFLRQVALTCDPATTPQRCEVLDAIFGHGDVEPGDLDRTAIICRPP